MKGLRLFFLICTVFLIFTLLAYPQEMMQASAASVELWFYQVLPSLFPFMVATGVLIRMGAAHHLGKLLQPIMKPVFGLSGVCAFPFLLGLISGYPMGAKITVMLYQEKSLSQKEAQSILGFCNNPGPLFVIGTAGTALLKNPLWGYFLMLCIFLASITTGILCRPNPLAQKTAQLFTRTKIHKKNTEAFGTLLGKSIADAMETILQIGGFIILFGVLIQALHVTGVSDILSQWISQVLPVSKETVYGIFGGILEMTNGISLLSQTDCTPVLLLVLCAAILSFGGLSILGQTLGILAAIPVNTGRYFLMKGVNAFFAGVYAYLLFPLLEKYASDTIAVFHLYTQNQMPYSLPYFLFLGIVLVWGIFTHQKNQKKIP